MADEYNALAGRRFGGQWALEAFTTHHWISVQRTPCSFPI